MLKKLLCVWLSLIFFSCTVAQGPQAGAPTEAALPDLGDMQMPALSEADIKEALKFLETLPPEELDALAKFGETVMEKAEKEGLDAREIFGIPSDEELQRIIESISEEAPPAETKPEKLPAPEVKEEKVTIPLASKAEIQQTRSMLKRMVSVLENVVQKAEIDRKTRDIVKQMNFILVDLIYYLNALTKEQITKYLFDEEFENIYTKLKQLDRKITQLEPQFDLPENFYEGINPYTILGLAPNSAWDKTNQAYQKLLIEHDPQALKKRLQKAEVAPEEIEKKVRQARKQFEEFEEAYALILERERAMQAFQMIAETLTEIVYNQKLIDDIKKIMKKYEPEALKVKEEQEQREAKARKDQEELLRRRPPYTPIIFEPPTPPRPTVPEPTKPTPYVPPIFKPTPEKEAPAAPGIPDLKDKKAEPGKPDLKDKKRKPGEAVADKEEKPKDKLGREITLDPKLTKKLENIEKKAGELYNFVNTPGPMVGATPTPAPKILLKDFPAFLAKPIQPLNSDSPEFIKTKQVHAVLKEMLKFLADINKEFFDLEKINPEQGKLFLREVHTILKNYNFFEKIKDVFKLHLDKKTGQIMDKEKAVTIAPAKGYILMGIDFPDMDDPENKFIIEVNKERTNMLGEFYRATGRLKAYMEKKK